MPKAQWDEAGDFVAIGIAPSDAPADWWAHARDVDWLPEITVEEIKAVANDRGLSMLTGLDLAVRNRFDREQARALADELITCGQSTSPRAKVTIAAILARIHQLLDSRAALELNIEGPDAASA
jgi:hypothetical protein